MTETFFGDDWTVEYRASGTTIPVRLPHDAMIGGPRSPGAPAGYHGAYFAGPQVVYRKTWTPPADAVRARLRFEGIGGSARIAVDGAVVREVDSRYREVVVDLDPYVRAGRPAAIEVAVDDSAQPNSRWYTGSGLYRPVWLDVTGPARFAEDGLTVVTRRADARSAELSVDVTADGDVDEVVATLWYQGERVSIARGVPGELTWVVERPRRWSADAPELYDLDVELMVAGAVSDRRRERIGIRTIELDARRGLLINGEPTLLRGACVHHDSGILGAATHRAAEFRRARILKENGFNAIRSAHNPLSRDLIDACDQVGLYVMDELTDVWFEPKTANDASSRFAQTWPDDLASMVAKDRNRPSVIMYSIGNEIAESATPRGIAAAETLADACRALDSTRPTLLAVNFLLNMLAARGKSVFSMQPDHGQGGSSGASKATSTVANVIADKLGAITTLIAQLPEADRVSREAFEKVDIAGYNYGWARYRKDARKHPDRVVCGSESMTGDLPRIWPLVESLPGVIGDFMWTGWEYLGEAGLGSWAYGDERVPLTKPYPYITAGTGAIDLLGRPAVGAALARAVWRDGAAPAIHVRPLDVAGAKIQRSAWRHSDAVASWAWRGAEGAVAEVEVYSAADEVKLLLDGRPIGRARAGARREFVARFRVPYVPGELTAIAYTAGVESGRAALRAAGSVTLHARAERETLVADGRDLGFVEISVADDDGTVEQLDDDVIAVDVDGPAELVALGSAAPANAESYGGGAHRSYRGRLLAIVRSDGGVGTVTVTARSQRHGVAVATLSADTESVLAHLGTAASGGVDND